LSDVSRALSSEFRAGPAGRLVAAQRKFRAGFEKNGGFIIDLPKKCAIFSDSLVIGRS